MPEDSAVEPSYFAKLCRGEAGIWVNLLAWPAVLLWNALYHYVFACLRVVGGRATRGLLRPFIECCFTFVYTDAEWSGQTALGEECEFKDENVSWVRVAELVEGNKVKLFEGKIEPADLVQGKIGNCWLVAALACAAEHPASIRNVFLTPEYNPRGKYRVRLFDNDKRAFVIIKIDDRIPCKKGTKTPLFMEMQGNELWAVLLEKAFAKLWGSYHTLDGGIMYEAQRALTGDHVFRLQKHSLSSGSTWKRGNESYTPDQAWVLVQRYVAADSFVSAGGASGDAGGGGLNGEDLDTTRGIVGGHAYSILSARELGLIPGLSALGGLLGKTKLVQRDGKRDRT